MERGYQFFKLMETITIRLKQYWINYLLEVCTILFIVLWSPRSYENGHNVAIILITTSLIVWIGIAIRSHRWYYPIRIIILEDYLTIHYKFIFFNKIIRWEKASTTIEIRSYESLPRWEYIKIKLKQKKYGIIIEKRILGKELYYHLVKVLQANGYPISYDKRN